MQQELYWQQLLGTLVLCCTWKIVTQEPCASSALSIRIQCSWKETPLLSPAAKYPIPGVGVNRFPVLNITAWISCSPLAQWHQLCILVFEIAPEQSRNARGIQGISYLFHSQPTLWGSCISLTTEKYRDTSGEDFKTSGGSSVFPDVSSLLKPFILWDLITFGVCF